MAGAIDLTGALESVSEVHGSSRPRLHILDADPDADVKKELALSNFASDLDRPLGINRWGLSFSAPSIFSTPASLGAAFGTALFDNRLEAMATEIASTASAENYLVNWNTFMGDFVERVFVVRALLEAAAGSETDEHLFHNVAAHQISKIDKMIGWALVAFQHNVEGELRQSWPFNLVGMQLERINQPLNAVNYFPQLIEKYDGERLEKWRDTTISELSRLTDPMTYLRGVETNEAYESTLMVDLPNEEIDLFFAHPDGSHVDLTAVKANARSFFYLWSTLLEIAKEAGRNDAKETAIAIRYNSEIGAFLIKDMKPIVDGALYPFATEPPRSRLYSIVDRMGFGSNLFMKGALFGTTVSKMVLQLPYELAPERGLTFNDAVSAQVELNGIVVEAQETMEVASSSEDSGVNPMESLFPPAAREMEVAEDIGGAMRADEPDETSPIEDLFKEIDTEAREEEEAAAAAAAEAANASGAIALGASPNPTPLILK